MKKFLRC